MIATTRRSFRVVITTRMIELETVRTCYCDAHGPLATIGPFGHVNSMCVLAPTSTLLAEFLFHVSAVECTCHRHANSLCPLAMRPQSGPKWWPASHRRRTLEVAIFIVDGTHKYRLNEREVKYPTSERITTILALHGEHSTTTLMAFQFSVSIKYW